MEKYQPYLLACRFYFYFIEFSDLNMFWTIGRIWRNYGPYPYDVRMVLYLFIIDVSHL